MALTARQICDLDAESGESAKVERDGELFDRERGYSLLLYDRKGDERGGFGTFDSGKAVCVLEGGTSLTAEDLAAFVAARIASYKKPRYVEFVSALPKTADGSIDRSKVKALYGQS